MSPTTEAQRARVILATKFPPKYIEDTIVPGLTAIGADVVRVVGTDFDGRIADVDAVLFMFQYCGHDEYKVFKSRSKAAGVRFVTLTRQSSEWVSALRIAGIRLPVVRSSDLQAAPPPTSAPIVAPSPPPPRVRTFGAALRAARSSEEVTPDFVADLCEVSVTDVEAWEADRAPIDVDAYDKLTELFVSLMDAPSPNITRRSLPRPAPLPAVPASVRGPAPSPAPTPPPASTPQAPAPVVPFQPTPQPAAPPPIAAQPAKERNGHAVVAPLTSLLRAARALGIKDDLHVAVTDAGVEVKLGSEKWTGATDEEATTAARRAMDERLGALLRRVTEARQLLGLAIE
jgi:hypothetical protein